MFRGERLQLAREFRGMTQKELSEKVAASRALISLCEAGKKREPAPDLVEACGAILGFEPVFFYGSIDDVFREGECSFRHRRTTPERLKTQIRAHATLLGMVIQRLRSLFRFPDINVPHIPTSSAEEIEAAAEECRKHWEIGVDAPILQVGRALERAGVIIVRQSTRSGKVDAFSRYGRTTVIFLNEGVPSTSRWNFDIAHECGHLVMHRGIPTGTVETEMAADRFASAFLMPSKAFGREFSLSPFSWEHIFDLKRRWQTSAAAIVRRAYDLRLLDAVTYRQAFKYMSTKGWTRGEPDEPSFQNPELLVTALDALGAKVDLTLDALCRDLRFTPDTFCDITGVSVPAPKGRQSEIIEFRRA
ncbi:MAG TPA: XRE family transcriptional regulator [Terriglobia bacterium]|nr:XRE family transcriptional regulator [Terriglobia bacterium]